MANIEKFTRLPDISKLQLNKIFTKGYDQTYDYVELIITIQQGKINIKEFSDYLNIIYKIDGFLSEIGYTKYVHYPNLQIEIEEIRFGSVELVLEKILHAVDGNNLIIIYLVLKYIPEVVKTVGETIFKSYEILNAREDYLEKKERRKFRKQIREQVNKDESLSYLEKKQKEKLVIILDAFYIKVGKRLIPASRFVQKFVKNIRLIPKSKQ